MTDPPAPRIAVLFVCYANVCRSPLAEGVFRRLVAQRGLGARFQIDSAGTSAIEGSAPHPLSLQVAGEHGIVLESTARQLLRSDLGRFDHILLMDRFNREELRRMAGPAVFAPGSGLRARVRLLREAIHPETADIEIPDPIGMELPDYQHVYALILEACEALLDELLADG